MTNLRSSAIPRSRLKKHDISVRIQLDVNFTSVSLPPSLTANDTHFELQFAKCKPSTQYLWREEVNKLTHADMIRSTVYCTTDRIFRRKTYVAVITGFPSKRQVATFEIDITKFVDNSERDTVQIACTDRISSLSITAKGKILNEEVIRERTNSNPVPLTASLLAKKAQESGSTPSALRTSTLLRKSSVTNSTFLSSTCSDTHGMEHELCKSLENQVQCLNTKLNKKKSDLDRLEKKNSRLQLELKDLKVREEAETRNAVHYQQTICELRSKELQNKFEAYNPKEYSDIQNIKYLSNLLEKNEKIAVEIYLLITGLNPPSQTGNDNSFDETFDGFHSDEKFYRSRQVYISQLHESQKILIRKLENQVVNISSDPMSETNRVFKNGDKKCEDFLVLKYSSDEELYNEKESNKKAASGDRMNKELINDMSSELESIKNEHKVRMDEELQKQIKLQSKIDKLEKEEEKNAAYCRNLENEILAEKEAVKALVEKIESLKNENKVRLDEDLLKKVELQNKVDELEEEAKKNTAHCRSLENEILAEKETVKALVEKIEAHPDIDGCTCDKDNRALVSRQLKNLKQENIQLKFRTKDYDELFKKLHIEQQIRKATEIKLETSESYIFKATSNGDSASVEKYCGSIDQKVLQAKIAQLEQDLQLSKVNGAEKRIQQENLNLQQKLREATSDASELRKELSKLQSSKSIVALEKEIQSLKDSLGYAEKQIKFLETEDIRLSRSDPPLLEETPKNFLSFTVSTPSRDSTSANKKISHWSKGQLKSAAKKLLRRKSQV